MHYTREVSDIEPTTEETVSPFEIRSSLGRRLPTSGS